MKFTSFETLIDRINEDLGDFKSKFAYKRKELADLGKAPNRNVLFKYTDSDRDWAINEGGGTEIQYHLFYRDNTIGYGLGFNAQYVPFANEMSPVAYIKPFVSSYLNLLKQKNPTIIKLKNDGFAFIEGEEKDLNSIENDDYYLFGKEITIDSSNNISDKDYNQMIDYLKNDIYKLYVDIWEEKIKATKTNENMVNAMNLLTANHNLILTGAPGTGKTYLAKQIAQQMIFGEIKDEMNPNEEKQFNEQCGFVQFHPSYDYTDFVEGLRPVKSVKDDNKNIGFERKDGVFKAFCKNALIKQTANASVTDKLNDNPTVWKVSLAKTGDNAIRKYCMDHGCIRIGWDDYGDIEDFSDYNGFTNGGKNVLNAFQNQMKQGDIIASCWSENEIDAIGVVTGDYEYNDALSDYKRVRKVDWLVKGIKEYIVAINNNKKFTPSTVYMSNISVEDALKIVTKHSTQTINNVNRHFVFIIDEINRGEISKIFGELFFSVDHGYRGEKGRVQTQYQNIVEDGDIFKKGFFVPENVYIIGTMNDIDRSVESMDFAFRRRFAFKEIKATDRVEMLDDLTWKDEAVKRMNRLNAKIEIIEGLSSAYHIGPAYFLKLKNYNGDFDQLWENHLEGLLREYLRGMQNLEEKLKTLKAAYDNESDSDSGQQQE